MPLPSNTRQIVFISPPDVKNSASPDQVSGISRSEQTANISIRGATITSFGSMAATTIKLANPYTADTGAGANPLDHRRDRVVVRRRINRTGSAADKNSTARPTT